MSNQVKDLTGARVGRLQVLRCAGRNRQGNYQWVCQCDCGRQVTVSGGHLTRSVPTLSCGCLAVDTARRTKTKHGHAASGRETPEYLTWRAMLQRCYCRTHHAFDQYGGRGIGVCSRWRRSFEAFLADMGRKPGPTYSIDRIENDRGYEPGNCRWATKTEQARNRRTVRIVDWQGKRQTIAEWALETGLSVLTIRQRLRSHWSIERTLTQPQRHVRRMVDVNGVVVR